jgi:hypothetical protein
MAPQLRQAWDRFRQTRLSPSGMAQLGAGLALKQDRAPDDVGFSYDKSLGDKPGCADLVWTQE